MTERNKIIEFDSEDESTKFKKDKQIRTINDKGAVRIFQLFRYSSFVDVLILLLGIIGSICSGVIMPIQTYLIGQMIDNFDSKNYPAPTLPSFASSSDISTNDDNSVNEVTSLDSYDYSDDDDGIKTETMPSTDDLLSSGNMYDPQEWNQNTFDELKKKVYHTITIIVYFGLGFLIAGFLQSFCFFVLSQRQSIKIRTLYFESLLRQDATWYDFQESGDLTSRIGEDLQEIEEGMSIKFGDIIQILSQVIMGYVIGFLQCWDLTLVLFACTPFYLLSMFGFGFIFKVFGMLHLKQMGIAGSIAEETIGNMRTVHSLNKVQEFCAIYDVVVKKGMKFKIMSANGCGICMGIMMFFVIGSLGLGGWYGSLVLSGKGAEHKDPITVGMVLVCFMCVVNANQALSGISNPINILSTARAAAYRIYATIDRVPDIDSKSTGGLKPSKCEGSISFEDVKFAYPLRPERNILNGISVRARKGEIIALVGSSGCGKSSIMSLLQRNYDVDGGKIRIDKNQISELNIKWLRNQIGIVRQEPSLFACSIRQNIIMGARDGELPSEEDIIKCAKIANAHDFIMKLPQKYDTIVGQKGTFLSGGQKQRIAIARALIRNPSILLLDEATSALDTQSEKLVHEALERTAQERTTIIIAHRLSTVRNADRIYVLDRGEIVEEGKHDELMAKEGVYYQLAHNQQTDESELDIIGHKEKKKNAGDGYSIVDTDEPKDIIEQIEKEYKMEMREMEDNNKNAFIKVIINNIKNDFMYVLIGSIAAVVGGAIYPAFTVKMVDTINVLWRIVPGQEIPEKVHDEVMNNTYTVLVISAITVLVYYFFGGFFYSSGHRLLARLHSDYYKAIMRQEIGWFDRKENMAGILTTRLSMHSMILRGLAGEKVGEAVLMFSTIICSCFVAFYNNWKIALCEIAITPIIIILLLLNGKFNQQKNTPAIAAYEQSGATMVEAVTNVKTVQSISKEEFFSNKFQYDLYKPKMNIFKLGPPIAITMALNNFVTFGAMAYGYFIGLTMVKKDLDFTQDNYSFVINLASKFIEMQKVNMVIVYAAKNIGGFIGLLPDFGIAVKAAKNTYNIIERRSKIDPTSLKGDIPQEKIRGEIEFKRLCFRYPTRPENAVLKGISFKARRGKTTALVGASGCGKSTTIQLIERFYDPTYGEVLLDGYNLRDINIQFLRNQIGLVQQEPVLFNGSVMDNIKKGLPNGVQISNEEIYEVCKTANVHDFILSLPNGYFTFVGDKGSQLSGGQKQRIAIARALVKNPKVLLLDEATSALDTESEKNVQIALEQASKGKTTIVIAHRLSTIQNADEILVISRGRIAEKGTHQELLQKKGFYYSLAKQQFGTV